MDGALWWETYTSGEAGRERALSYLRDDLTMTERLYLLVERSFC
jgi:hypothetical protein